LVGDGDALAQGVVRGVEIGKALGEEDPKPLPLGRVEGQRLRIKQLRGFGGFKRWA
jgi:hypothetical protein